MQKIIPHLWFNTQAVEAAALYTSIFPDSTAPSVTALHNTPSGDAQVVSFKLAGYAFMAINGGPLFTFNPSISFIVNFDPSMMTDARKKLDTLWHRLGQGGSVRMPLQAYPFSKRYGWVQDAYGVSWQLMLTDPAGEDRPFITPSLTFADEACGKAEAATDFYLSVFKNARRGTLARYPKGMDPDKEGTVMFTDIMLEGQWFGAMDSARMHDGAFNEAISFLVRCDSQTEIDYYWSKLSAHPESEQCGWLKDKYGVSWQITPAALHNMIAHGSREQVNRVTQAFLPMKKLDLATIEKAYNDGPD